MNQNDVNPIPLPTPERADGSFFSDEVKQWLRKFAWLIVVVGVIGVLMLFWFEHLADKLPKPEVGVFVAATPSKPLASIPKHKAAIKNGSVSVYDSQAKSKLDLPAEIVQDKTKEVAQSTQVEADDHPQTVSTILNTDTGEFETFVRRDPLPWIAWDDHGELGIYGGIKNGALTARLEAKQGVFQIKAVHVGGIASVDQAMQGPLQADYFVGVGAWYRW